jgi:uncharacterized membrane protein
MAALASVGLAVAAYLAACQLGLARPWDPIFGLASSARVLHSALARALPVPDAVLGTAGSAAEIVTGLAGGRTRWRTHPWLVLSFGAVAAGLALVGIGLIGMQVLFVHSACTLCLASALVSIGVAGTVAVEGEVQAALRVAKGGAGGPVTGQDLDRVPAASRGSSRR